MILNLGYHDRKPNITGLVIYWEYTKFGQHCDIQRIGTKFGVISELEFVLNSTLLKVHVSKWYRRRFSTLLNYGLMRGKIRSFDCDNDFLDLPWRIYTFFSQYFFLDFVPESKIWRTWKFVRCANEMWKIAWWWIYSRNLQFGQSVGCAV